MSLMLYFVFSSIIYNASSGTVSHPRAISHRQSVIYSQFGVSCFQSNLESQYCVRISPQRKREEEWRSKEEREKKKRQVKAIVPELDMKAKNVGGNVRRME